MPVTLKGTVQVDHPDLRAAFEAVRPHAAPGKRGDEVLPLHRVRLIAAQHILWVLAAGGGTMALAKVPIHHDTRPTPEALDDGPFVVDVPPAEVDDFKKVFKLRRQGADDDPQMNSIELTFETHQLTFEQGPGGMFPGKTMGVPLSDPAEQFPDVLGWVARAVRNVSGQQAKPLATGSATLGMWAKAAKAYAQPAWILGSGDHTNPAYVVRVGDSFLGTFGSGGFDDTSTKRHTSIMRNWLEVLPSRAPLGEANPYDAVDEDDAGPGYDTLPVID